MISMSGFGGPLAIGIILIGLLGAISTSVPIIYSSNNNINRCEERKFNREYLKMRTKIEIVNVDVSANRKFLYFDINNTGQESIQNPANLSVFFDVVAEEWYHFDDNAPGWTYSITPLVRNPVFWDPDETLMMTILLVDRINSGTYYLVVATPNGVTDTFQWIYTV